MPFQLKNDRMAGNSALYALICAATALALLYVLRSIVVPLFISSLLMMLIDGQVREMKRIFPRAPARALSALTVALVVACLGACIFLLTFGASGIVAEMPVLTSRVDGILADISGALGSAPLRLNDLIDEEVLIQLATPAVSSLSSIFASAVLAILFLGFMLASRHAPATKLATLARTPEGAERMRGIIDRIGRGAGTYMWVQTVTGAIYAAASGAVLYFMGLDNVPFWTILIFLLSYIPMLGVAVASIAPALFALIQFPTYWQAIAVFAAVQSIAFVVGNIVLPKMQADSQNIDPTISVFSVALWTLLWGVPGAFLAIPLTAVAMIVFAEFEQTRWAAILISDNGVPECDAASRKQKKRAVDASFQALRGAYAAPSARDMMVDGRHA